MLDELIRTIRLQEELINLYKKDKQANEAIIAELHNIVSLQHRSEVLTQAIRMAEVIYKKDHIIVVN